MTRSTRTLILMLVAAATLALMAVSYASLTGLERIGRNEESEVEVGLGLMQAVYQVRSAATERSAAVRGYVLTGDASLLETRQAAGVEFTSALATLGELGRHVSRRQAVHALSQAHRAVSDRVVALRRAGRTAEATALLSEESLPLKARLDAAIEALIESETRDIALLHAEVDRIEAGAVSTVRLAILGAIPLFVGMAFLLIRRILVPLRDLESAAAEVGAGRLAHRVPVRTSDEFGRVAGAFNAMALQVESQVAELQAAHQTLQAQEEELRVAYEDLQSSHEELSAQSEELALQEEELRGAYEDLQATHEELTAQSEELTAQAEALRSANEQLREADRYKDDFLGILSHELRTPLNFICGFASILEDEVPGPLNAAQRENVGKIMLGADRMLTLVDDLLDVARIGAGKLVVEPAMTRYDGLVADVIATLRPEAESRGVALEATVQVSQEVLLDEHRIHQVLSNLIANGIKFTSDGGRIRVAAFEAGDMLVTEVTDTGIGIAPEDQADIFGKFQQVDMSSTRRAGGVGLGLAICKALVEAHGGRIEVESFPGRGTTFRYRLPLQAQAPRGAWRVTRSAWV